MNLLKKIRVVFVVGLSLYGSAVWAQRPLTKFEHVEPAFWWVGMQSPELQILFHQKDVNLAAYNVSLEYPGVTLKKVKKVENPNYLFVSVAISPHAKAGVLPIKFTNGKKTLTYQYHLKDKGNDPKRIQGFSAADVLYLIMPDRFSNGNSGNDSLPGMLEGAHRDKPGSRHGGDLKGIANHIDYLKDLGITALWLNPVLENNQPSASYHGYAITDLYKVDSRFGSNDEYVDFINLCHQNDLKVIQDMVMNHIGSNHYLMQDMPEKDWVHQFPAFTRSNYRGSAISDPYASVSDMNLMANGWFDHLMPDVNQQNELFATYLIQNTLWWIEYAGIDGIRMDTYPYPDKTFMARWAKTVMEEYPGFNIVGEVWTESIVGTAYWQKDMKNTDGYNSFLPSVTDFPLSLSIPKALNEPGTWDAGMVRLYNMLGQDFIYPDAKKNLIFVDNHDMTRFFLSVERNLDRFKQGLVFLLTTRGIPQLYYGTELLMDGDGAHHPDVRLDFPGGWPGDSINAFEASGRTAVQNDAHSFLKQLLNWRKTQPAIHAGKLIHFIPQDNVYMYIRTLNNQTVLVVLNGNNEEKQVATQRLSENLQSYQSGRDIFSGNMVDLKNLTVAKNGFLVLELQ